MVIPAAPTSVIAAAGNGQATVTWLAPTNTGGLVVSGYTVTSLPGGLTCSTTTALSCTITGLTNGTSYAFTVGATISVYGMTATSGASNIVTPATIPDPPTSVVAVGGSTTASVAWAAPADNGSPITSYTVTSAPGEQDVRHDRRHILRGPRSHARPELHVYGNGHEWHRHEPAIRCFNDHHPPLRRHLRGAHPGTHPRHPLQHGPQWSIRLPRGPYLQVTGHGGVPTDAIAVTGNLTVTGQTSGGYLFVGPVTMDNPTSSTLNFPVGDDRANGVTVALGIGGTLGVTFVGQVSECHSLCDLRCHGLLPARQQRCDVRTSHSGAHPRHANRTGLSGPSSSHVARTFQVTGNGGVPANATAVTGNLTVTGQTSGGYLFLGPNAVERPNQLHSQLPGRRRSGQRGDRGPGHRRDPECHLRGARLRVPSLM